MKLSILIPMSVEQSKSILKKTTKSSVLLNLECAGESRKLYGNILKVKKYGRGNLVFIDNHLFRKPKSVCNGLPIIPMFIYYSEYSVSGILNPNDPEIDAMMRECL